MDERTKVPLTHPDFRYAVARNPYAQKLKAFQDLAYSDHETESHSGEWRTLFPLSRSTPEHSRKRMLHVEIGCNTGHVTRAWAERDPETLFIGIDWKFKIIYRGAEKASEKKLQNILFFRANVERVRYMFAPGEVDRFSIFFPDPWPKKSQWKNRFLKESSLIDLAKVTRTGGVLHIKTDHSGYADWISDALQKVTPYWILQSESRDLYRDHPGPEKLVIPEVTLFEKLFIQDKIPIKEFILKRSEIPRS